MTSDCRPRSQQGELQGATTIALSGEDRQRYIDCTSRGGMPGTPDTISLPILYLTRALYPELDRLSKLRSVLPVLSTQSFDVVGHEPQGAVCVSWNGQAGPDNLVLRATLSGDEGEVWLSGELEFKLFGQPQS